MDVSTNYMGMSLKNPIVASAGPLSHSVHSIRRLEDAGAAAVVLHSLFEEQLNAESRWLDYYLSHGTESHPEAVSYFPEMDQYNVGPEEYLDLIAHSEEVVAIPVIASLNGVSTGGWIDYARLIQDAGADGLELNVYYLPTSLYLTGAEVEEGYLQVLSEVKKAVSIPVAVKLSPFFSATANMSYRLSEEGADALVLFNRFYQPDIDLDELEILPHLSLSTSEDLRLPLRWIAILYGRIPADLAATGGVHTCQDLLKCLMAGASAAQMTSELLQRGVYRISEILMELQDWMERREYVSVSQMIGSLSQRNVPEPAAFERANYMRVLASYPPVV